MILHIIIGILFIISIGLLALSIMTKLTTSSTQQDTSHNTSTESTASANSDTVTATSSTNWITPVILLLVVGLGGLFLWNSGIFSSSHQQTAPSDKNTPPAQIIPNTTTGPPIGCPDCVEIPYISAGGRKFHLNWQEIKGFEAGDTLYFWGIEIEGLGGGPQSNSLTPDKIHRGVTVILAREYGMPYPLYGQIKKRQ